VNTNRQPSGISLTELIWSVRNSEVWFKFGSGYKYDEIRSKYTHKERGVYYLGRDPRCGKE
jgi:hypothetical protein